MFFPGETVTHKFIIPFAGYVDEEHPGEVKKVIVSYKQGDHIVLEKEVASIDVKSEDTSAQTINHISSVTITLGEQDSLLFEDNVPVFIQINVFTASTRHTSRLMKSTSGIQFHREVENNA